MTYYKVLNKDGRSVMEREGIWKLPCEVLAGEWMPAIKNVKIHEWGYHLHAIETMLKWIEPMPGWRIWVTEGRGGSIPYDAKPRRDTYFEQARILRPTFWNDEGQRLFVAECRERQGGGEMKVDLVGKGWAWSEIGLVAENTKLSSIEEWAKEWAWQITRLEQYIHGRV